MTPTPQTEDMRITAWTTELLTLEHRRIYPFVYELADSDRLLIADRLWKELHILPTKKTKSKKARLLKLLYALHGATIRPS